MELNQSKANFSFPYPKYCRKRFNFSSILENKKSNSWANALMQILYATPLKILVENLKFDTAVVLNNLFGNMPKVTKTPMSIVDLNKVTDICNIPMAIKIHQDVDDLLNIMLNNLVEDPLCGSSIRSLFQCCSKSIKCCAVCSNIQYLSFLQHYRCCIQYHEKVMSPYPI